MEFYCEKLNWKMDESTCLQYRISESMKNTCYNCKIPYKEASKILYHLIQSRIQEGTKVLLEDDGSIYLSFHEYLNIHIYYYGSKEEAYIEIDCGKYGRINYSLGGSEVLEDISSFIDSTNAIVVKFWRQLSMIETEAIKKNPQIILLGVGVRIITKDGCFTKKDFLKEIKAQG